MDSRLHKNSLLLLTHCSNSKLFFSCDQIVKGDKLTLCRNCGTFILSCHILRHPAKCLGKKKKKLYKLQYLLSLLNEQNAVSICVLGSIFLLQPINFDFQVSVRIVPLMVHLLFFTLAVSIALVSGKRLQTRVIYLCTIV